MPLSHEKRCGECGTLIIGRIDKKFCSDHCRNTFNNRLNRDVTKYIRNTNRALRKNRRILMELNPGGKAKVSRDNLMAHGFDFNHFTSVLFTAESNRYFYCYEQGYHPLGKDLYLLVVKKEF